MNKRIFISYSRNDRALVLTLVERINQELGLECWIDMKGIENGEVRFHRQVWQGCDSLQLERCRPFF
jgi:hypothetical protein